MTRNTGNNVTKLNALRRLTMKVHAEPAPRKRKVWGIRLYDGDVVVGYVGYMDLVEAQVAFKRMVRESERQKA